MWARTIVLAFALMSAGAAAQDQGSPASNVSVTEVTLATGGLAQVRGRMDEAGNVMRLAIERGQVADVLRTLVVTGDAPIVSVDLEAAEPVGARSVTGRLLADDLSDPRTVLAALRGKELSLRAGPNQLSGRLIAFTEATIPGSSEAPERPAIRVSVATAEGTVRYATFPTQEPLVIEGDAVDAQLTELMPALSELLDDGRRDLAVRLDGEARAGFTFVVPTTVWRPSYRALIDDEGGVSLQGWATLENTTGLDWTEIALRLAVGTPVAYAQDVYAPLRVARPEAPFEVGRTMETDVPARASVPASADARRNQTMARTEAAAAGLAADPLAASAPSPVDTAAELVIGAATAGTASTVFDVSGPISLDAGRTLTVPFLSQSRDVARVTYVDLLRGTDAMDALEVSFDPEATVPGGLVAVYDSGGFVGDARFGGAAGGELRLLPFAASAEVIVTRTSVENRVLTSAEFRDGALIITRNLSNMTELSADAARPGTLIADLLRQGNETFELVKGDGEITVVDLRTGRLRAELQEGANAIVFVGTRPITERFVIGNIPNRVVEDVLSAGGAVDEATRARLLELSALAAQIAQIDREMEALEREADALREAVATDRRNLDAIDVRTPEGAEVRARIVRRTNEIDALLTQLRELGRERLAIETELRG